MVYLILFNNASHLGGLCLDACSCRQTRVLCDAVFVYMFLMLALCRSPIQKTLGISQPIHSTAKIYQRAFQLKELGGTIITVDQTPVYDMVWPLLASF